MKHLLKNLSVVSIALLAFGFAQYPVTIENCGRTLIFEKAPERAVTLRSIAAEFMVKLDLQDKLIGIANIDPNPPSDLSEGLAMIPILSEGPIAKEVLLKAEPDFILAAYEQYDFNVSAGMLSVDDAEASGGQVYLISANCATDPNSITIDDVYADLLNLAKIFGVEENAQEIVNGVQAELAELEQNVATYKTPSVAFLDIGENGQPVWVYANGIYKDLLERAGAKNIFADLDQQFLEISAEEVALRNPDVFLIVDSRFGAPAEGKIELIYEIFPNTTATLNQRAYMINEMNVLPGVRNFSAITELAKAFHPEVSEE